MLKESKILIITDNPIIAKRFENEVWSLVDFEGYKLSFRCSPHSRVSDFDLVYPIETIDLKEKEMIMGIMSYDLIISIHCKQLFPAELIEKVRCVNVHPGYNPINRGWYPQVFSIIHGLDIGATIHEIDGKLDHGEIIAREKVEKFSFDTSLTLYERVVEKEIELLKKNIITILANNYTSIEPENSGNLFLKKDFNNLCQLDLNEELTMKKAIDRLRALTHGVYKNAFYYDDIGRKIFVSINLENEERR